MADANNSAPSNTDAYSTNLSLGVWHCLSQWKALTKAVQDNWGGPDSSDKRDWLAGAVADILLADPKTDEQDLTEVLLQAMEDEFEVRVEDDSEERIVEEIMRIWKECQHGDFTSVKEMQRVWEARKGKEEVVRGNVEERNQDADDSVDDESESENDIEMGDAPTLVPAIKKEKPLPEIDEEGFTTVVPKRKNR